MDALAAFVPLAPLHQPAALALVGAAAQRWPGAVQVGVFDTSWHQSMPEAQRLFPIPYALSLRGVKRFGFHGLAFQSAMRQLAALAPELAPRRVVLAHLGGGSSLAAVLERRCVSTTMGMTPLDGLPMATRPGALDPGVLLHLQRGLGMDAAAIDQLLWHDSGLKGLSGESADMRSLLGSASEGARRAVDVYVSRVAQGIAAMAACIGGVDALAFSGGVGAHAGAIRARVAHALGWMGVRIDPLRNEADAHELSSQGSLVRTFALAVDEELEIALEAMAMQTRHQAG
jgi:acetate kinase